MRAFASVPWEAKPYRLRRENRIIAWDITDADGVAIAQVYLGDSEAAARLMAAAPDLLAACKAALIPAGDTPAEVRHQLWEAIAKAEPAE